MSTSVTKISVSLFCFHDRFRRFSSTRLISSFQTLEESVRAAVEAKTYQQIPELIVASKESCLNPNPFSFLSIFPPQLRIQIVDEILQSFIPIRPRSCPQVAYSCLLSHTLQNPNPLPLPLPLAILQRTLLAGCIPSPKHTFFFLLHGLTTGVNLIKAVKVLNGVSGAGCVPDLESYDAVIGAMCAFRRTSAVADKVKEMVAKIGLTPRQETVVKVVATMQASKQIWKAVEMIEFLEKAGFPVGFESYALMVKGCLECRKFVLSGKVVVMMTGKGFVLYIRARQKVVEGLASVGEQEFASAMRQKFIEFKY